MQFLSVLIMAAVLAIIMLPCVVLYLRRHRRTYMALANIGEGTHGSGRVTLRTDAAITTRYLIGKRGSDANHVAVAGAADFPLGTISDEAGAAEDLVCVDTFGGTAGTRKGVASAAISIDDLLVVATGGKLKTLPGSTGNYWIIGRALQAAGADGDELEYVPCFPVLRVV